MDEQSQFGLLRTRRFLPFFLTQFAGAFNDNIFRNALIILIAFSATDSDLLINLCAGLFILPFFLFSATAGQIAEKFEKSRLIRLVKLAEIAIMAMAAVAFLADSLAALIALLFLMGTQSTFFGPVKYAILPQQLREEELVGGNGLVEMGTFVAILLGTITGGLLIAQDRGPLLTGIVVVLVAVIGWLVSRRIPISPATAPELKIDWNVLRETANLVRIARRVRSVYLSILGISWFWMLGAVYLTQFPNYTRTTLGGDEEVVTLLLATFSIGVGAGSLLCERLSGRMVELGLVPFGSIGLSLFGLDLFFAQNLPWLGADLRGAAAFVADPVSWRIIVDLLLIGVFGGFYVVPLYALIQNRTEPEYRSRVIAANNIFNALFMVGAAVLAAVMLRWVGLSIPGLFLVMTVLNVGVAAYIYGLVPEFLMRFLIWMLTSTMYRIKRTGLENIPDEGAAVIVCNHVSYVDAPIIAGSVRRPIRFVMDRQIFRIPVLNFIFRTAGAVPIAPRREDPEAYDAAFTKVAEYLAEGEVVCIFPEGRLTSDGEMGEFRHGIERILADSPVPVIPMALRGLWGSFFSPKHGRSLLKRPRRFWSRIEIAIGPSIPVARADIDYLHANVLALRGDWR
jgi:1-acyl-sn-glycerol-3-phosphate acyltransferase